MIDDKGHMKNPDLNGGARMKWILPVLFLLAGPQVADAKAGPRSLIPGRYRLSYTLKPTEAFHARLTTLQKGSKEMVEALKKMHPEIDQDVNKMAVEFFNFHKAYWTRKLTLEVEGMLTVEAESNPFLIFSTGPGSESGGMRLASVNDRVLGYQHQLGKGGIQTNQHLEAFQLVGSFKNGDSALVEGRIIWLVDGEVFGRGTFSLRHLPEKNGLPPFFDGVSPISDPESTQ